MFHIKTLELVHWDFWRRFTLPLDAQIITIVGPNGSGKTTLLHTLVGLLRPLRGGVRHHPTLATRTALGFVPQRCDLNPALPTTVREFVGLGLVGLGLGRVEAASRVPEALARVDLGPQIDTEYWRLSGGQRQRALLARALARRPATLLADEPTSGLDPRAVEDLLAVLHHMHRQQGLTLVLVTHDLGLAARHASHVALVHEGRVHAGTRSEVLRRDRLERLYGAAVADAFAPLLEGSA